MIATECSKRPASPSPLPNPLRDQLKAHFPPRRADYVARVLTAEELSVIADLADALIIARIKRMPERKLRRLDRMEPIRAEDRRLFRTLQSDWLCAEEYLLSTRLGRRPSHRELFADFNRNHNGPRFRAYFSLKFPDRVRRDGR